MDDSTTDIPNHTAKEATKMNDTEPSKGSLKTPSTAPRFKVAPVSAGKKTCFLMEQNILMHLWAQTQIFHKVKRRLIYPLLASFVCFKLIHLLPLKIGCRINRVTCRWTDRRTDSRSHIHAFCWNLQLDGCRLSDVCPR